MWTRRQAIAAALASGPVMAAAPGPTSRLVLLGTAGGPTPKPNRAASAQVIVVGDAAYVVDCGNGVARQLVLAGIKLKTLRSIFITHHHSDHVVDYGALMLLAWSADLATPVDSYGPPPLVDMTRGFLDVNRVDIAARIADEGRPPLGDLIRPHDISGAGEVMRDANVRVTAAIVEHPPLAPSFAYRFDCPDRSIVVSGDTRPSEALVTLAKGADILVHEVMYLPALEALIATEPKAPTLRAHLMASHSSAADVGKLATRAGVKTLVLSHFVPGGFPFVTDDQWHDAVRPHFAGRIVVGRDLMVL